MHWARGKARHRRKRRKTMTARGGGGGARSITSLNHMAKKRKWGLDERMKYSITTLSLISFLRQRRFWAHHTSDDLLLRCSSRQPSDSTSIQYLPPPLSPLPLHVHSTTSTSGCSGACATIFGRARHGLHGVQHRILPRGRLAGMGGVWDVSVGEARGGRRRRGGGGGGGHEEGELAFVSFS